ncbi:MAG: methionyl-tRNA formyltransferase [candidate division KSB1 bacterium]|nr:methionyl-tRNA formyltransferase [candidate division KSB1 bacterium]MDZ7306911.1 methionyl-tRNA formyltransferase [candidate division KSB1 bacterium]
MPVASLQELKVVFMGTPAFAVPSLEKLLEQRVPVVAVVTGEDKRAGRGQQLRPSAVKQCALAHGLTVLQPARLDDPGLVDSLQRLRADVFVVVAFRILPPQVFRIPPRGTINIHAALLPKYRGAAPMQWAIINGETETGVTTFLINENVDAGQVLLQRRTPIGPEETLGELHDRLSQLGAELLLETLQQMQQGTLVPQPQVGEATPAPKITDALAEIDWQRPAVAICNLVRGLSPVPGAFTRWQGKILKILRSRVVPARSGDLTPGSVHHVDARSGELLVATGAGVLAVTELQLAGRRAMKTAEFLLGHRLMAGEKLGRTSPP